MGLVRLPVTHQTLFTNKQCRRWVWAKKSKKASVTLAPTQTQEPQTEAPQTDSEIEPHHINKAIIAIGADVLTGLVVWKR